MSGSDDVACPECDEPMVRERRMTIGGRCPFRCINGHLAVDENEPPPMPGRSQCGMTDLRPVR